ncbi:hypothetical protein [Chlorogloeopsis sp. ULAP02]|uniref:hypothetical protein n=1 Tax=Chlorogloeopsis sp. ULAP02 TaxID=3107926 RepID=UPI0031353ADD
MTEVIYAHIQVLSDRLQSQFLVEIRLDVIDRAEDIDRAAIAARQAFEQGSWSRMTPSERQFLRLPLHSQILVRSMPCNWW